MRLSRVLPALLAVCLCAFAKPSWAQARLVPAITFTGAPAYSQAELLAFTGLKPGTSITQQQLDDATQRLSDTGLFEEVTFSGSDKGLVYALKLAKAIFPAEFSNFVWWQDDELDRLLKARVPLYSRSAVPRNGNLQESVCTALKALLAEKGAMDASVTSIETSSGQIIFGIDSPPVLIRSLILKGVSPGMQPKIAHVLQEKAGERWYEDGSFKDISVLVGDDYRNDGYRDFALVDPQHSTPVITANDIEIDLMATIDEGAQYRVSQFDWAGSEILSTADFKKVVTLKVGNLDSAYSLQESLQLIAKAYRVKGYTLAKVSAPPIVDPASHQVAYTVSVEPGPLHRFSSVHFAGLSDELAKQLNAAWQMKPGDVYDDTYAIKFIAQNPALLKQGYQPKIQAKLDPVAHTADITISFSKAAAPK
jgi:outer membrane protein assembly factor BamA